ncbi:SAM-dependent methyltransferase [Rhodococcus oryzae]|uniref:SAM-dependent methyltransferase n=1 Tax=Rhodococcus oryzae TaxID=2571143 RepID=UPI0037223D1E
MSTTDAAPFWDGAHAARPVATNPQPNHLLTESVTGLPPGEALDLGCGNGGDALWLARRGWRVTAVDISAVAAARLADLAVAYGLGDFLVAERHDLRESFPPGVFDLICGTTSTCPSTWTEPPSCAPPRKRCVRAGPPHRLAVP